MNRSDRAKQFMPFDALKGLHDALRLKEYEHERIQKGDVSEEKIAEMTSTLISAEKGQVVKVTYFENGHYKEVAGKMKLNIEFGELKVDSKTISLDDIFDIVIIK